MKNNENLPQEPTTKQYPLIPVKNRSKLQPYTMKMKSVVLLSVIGILGIAFTIRNYTSFADPNPQKEAKIMASILSELQRKHYQPKAIDDDFSKQMYDFYLKEVDGRKLWLTQEDKAKLDGFSDMLDDEAKAGTFTFFDMSVTLLESSIKKTQGWYQEILAKPFNFKEDASMEGDSDKLPWAANDAELRTRWENLLKYELLGYITNEQKTQDKADFKGTKKTFQELEADGRTKTLDKYDKWFKRLQKFDRTKRLEVYFNALTNVFDPHTGYYSPREKENFDFQMSGKLEGIGARLQSDGEKTTVSDIVPGGPAWKDGQLQAKDVILKVAQEDAEAIDIMGWEIDDVVAKIRGPKGSKVTLTVQKTDGSQKQIVIERDIVITEEGFAKSLIINGSDKQDKIGYIYLPRFYADFSPEGTTSCAVDIEKEVDKLKAENVKGIILDLRNNGGGSLRDVVRMSGIFIEQGPIVQVKSRARTPEVMEDLNPDVSYAGPLVVMVNSFSASASEILAAALQDYNRAIIVGSTSTYGKGTVQRFVDLDNALISSDLRPLGQVKMTVQKFYRINGKTTQLDGVIPDIVLPDNYNYIELGEKENDYPLVSNTIDPVAYKQSVYQFSDKKKLVENSRLRTASNSTFQLIEENARRIKKQKDESIQSLQLDKYLAEYAKREAESDKFEDVLKPIDGFLLDNPAVDKEGIQSDTSKMARNDNWIKERQKDIQLYETLQIMRDMIHMDVWVGKQ